MEGDIRIKSEIEPRENILLMFALCHQRKLDFNSLNYDTLHFWRQNFLLHCNFNEFLDFVIKVGIFRDISLHSRIFRRVETFIEFRKIALRFWVHINFNVKVSSILQQR